MAESQVQKHPQEEAEFYRALFLALFCIPLIIWLLYNGYLKNSQSAAKTAACQERCSDLGHAGYEFKWPMFGGPQCSCLDTK